MGLTLIKYLGLSLLAASAVVYHAFATRQCFYRSTIYLSSSKIAVATMGNLAFALALCTHKLVIKLFLGSLRDIEQEMIRERLSSAVMESLLALTIFREEFSTFFVAMFASLVFMKVMHWLVQDRVDYVEVTPNISVLGHLRIIALMVLLLAVDAAFLQYTIAGSIESSGRSVMLLFAFEYVIQVSTIVRYALKYGMSMVDLAMDGNWTAKGTAVFYLELIADLLHLFVYSTFFVIVFSHYGLPLHLVRDLYSTFRNFRTRMQDFLRFRQVTARLDRFPDATSEDLRRCDGVCIICREEMAEAGANKRLYCGHVFHVHCLRSWLERQQNCPTCRASVFRTPTAATAAPNAAAAAAHPAAAGPPAQEQGAVAVANAAPAAVAAAGPAEGVADADTEPRILHPPAAAGATGAAAAGTLRHRHVSSGGPPAAATTSVAGQSAAPSSTSGSTPLGPSSTAAATDPSAVSALAPGTSRIADSAAVPVPSAAGAAPAVEGQGGGGAQPRMEQLLLQGALQVLRAQEQQLLQRLAAPSHSASSRRQHPHPRTRPAASDSASTTSSSASTADHLPQVEMAYITATAAKQELIFLRARISQLEAVQAELRAAGLITAAAAVEGGNSSSGTAAAPALVFPQQQQHGGLLWPPVGPVAAAFPAAAVFPPMLSPPFPGMMVPVMLPVPLPPAATVTTLETSAVAAASAAAAAKGSANSPQHHQMAAVAAAAAAAAMATVFGGAAFLDSSGHGGFQAASVNHGSAPLLALRQPMSQGDASGESAAAAFSALAAKATNRADPEGMSSAGTAATAEAVRAASSGLPKTAAAKAFSTIQLQEQTPGEGDSAEANAQ
ncbi:hypothetical protein Agub_g13411 [Astrephomene gubernaculifera]|uniref:RING-type E3 ubiquitin transferase n=1 Tax=Astrephomene gubernaculifera TaxID=47775 RepID=A0AAD3DZS4_9CHLO|nr:hypothetical protein Agub_g13411 [Astrephomene gubernaculifera]